MAEGIRRIKEEVAGVVVTLFSVYITLSLISYSKWDPSFLTHSRGPAKNYGGIIGSYISDTLLSLLGYISYLFPFFLIFYGIKRLLGKEKRKELLAGLPLFIISTPVLLSLTSRTFGINSMSYGGLWGEEASVILRMLLSLPGAYIFTLSVFFSSIIIMSPVSTSDVLRKVFENKKEDAPEPVRKIKVVEEPSQPMIKEMIKQGRVKEKKSGELPDMIPRKAGAYVIPPLQLLSTYETVAKPGKEELFERAHLLEEKLSDFRITGKITRVHPGPVVTMYEFEPSPGIKISKIVSLSDDLGRALGGLSIRIAPIPGKTPLGIEVPNKQMGIVPLKEIIDSGNFLKSQSRLTIALGKDIYGRPIVSDLSRMPHLLVAGTTGSGKSVSINSMIMSILFKSTPKEVKMLMIDPKLLELSTYDGIPHLVTPVVTNPKEATLALKKMVLEMERRYRLIAEQGARNLDNFNRQVPEEERLPYIIVIIDELADLMFTASKEVEDSIVRLAQMARASGIHLILATQRPSVDVITGIIKANFPTRIAFQVTTKVDSRTILDAQGAEQLIGKGDMLFMATGARLTRLHGAYVTEDEVRSVTSFIKAQGEPDFSMFDAIQLETAERAEEGSTEGDELYQQVIDHAENMGEISISSIQRRFKIGYNRAARIMELLEEEGFVGPPKGAGKPRDFIRRV
ncbi:DNA translocase SpoIIIE [bacterium BMS3Bbin07]|nr:DNA translocase SpoIIIE [bacterium BMS3Bbin07]